MKQNKPIALPNLKICFTTLMVTLLLTSFPHSALAYDFKVGGLCYNKNSDGNSVTVTYQSIYSPSYSNLSGALTIPPTVLYSNKTYAVTAIGNSAFSGCTGLTSVNIPNSVTAIGNSAFSGCTGLTSVNIPNSVTAIGNLAFSYCSGLTSVNIPNSVTAIGNAALNRCSALESIEVGNGNSTYDSRNNCNAIIETATNKLLFGCKNTIIPNSVTAIGNSAFSGCTGLTSVNIPNSVTTIGSNAFYNCTSLTSVNIPNSVTAIGDYAFYGCSGLTSVNIPNSVTAIGDYAFYGCSGLTSVNIPNSVTAIGFAAFYNCTGLTSVNIPNSVTAIGNAAFYNCTGLTSVNIPNSVTAIGNLAFNGCSALESIEVGNGNFTYDSRNNCNAIIETATNKLLFGCKNTIIPNSVTTIGNNAFYNCTGLTSVNIPNSVTAIGNSAFSGCSGLKYIICKPKTPPILHESLGVSNTLPIFVPSGSLTAYKNAQFWVNYNLRVSLTKVTPHTTQASFISEDNEISHLSGVKLNNKFYPASNDSIMITGLQPAENYSAIAICSIFGGDAIDTISFTTNPVKFMAMGGTSAQTSITPKFKALRDDAGFSVQSGGITCNGKEYMGKIIETTDDYYIFETTATGLDLNTRYYYKPWVNCNGKKCEGPQYDMSTQYISTSSYATTGPTSVEMTGSYNAGDAKVTNAYFTWNDQRMDKLVATGLKPNTNYSAPFTVVTPNGLVKNNFSFKTQNLTMTTQAVQMLTDTNPMFIASTNMADVETSCGFEWRRHDAPNDMPSSKVYCPVYNGTLAGVLKNMSPNVYYKCRPFYKAGDGTEYYGDWIAFFTGDANSSYEPVVYTYKVLSVTKNTATLQGVALPGSSEITEQGFEYWRMGNEGSVSKAAATGQRMSVTIENLTGGATYIFRAFVKAGGKTYYGNNEQFTTQRVPGDIDGTGKVNVSDVSSLINMILGISENNEAAADVNGDGRVNVSDISALINIILGFNNEQTKIDGTWEKNGLVDRNSIGTWTFIFNGNEATYIEKWAEPGYADDIEISNGWFDVSGDRLYMHLIYKYSSGSNTYDWTFKFTVNGNYLDLTPYDAETISYFRLGLPTIRLTKK